MNVVNIENLTVSYPGVKALDNISFSVDENNFLG